MRAYLLGYGFTVGPRVLTLLVYRISKLVRGAKRRAQDHDDGATERKPEPSILEAVTKILKAGLEVNRFATFCAAIVGGSTLLEVHTLSPPSLKSHQVIATRRKHIC